MRLNIIHAPSVPPTFATATLFASFEGLTKPEARDLKAALKNLDELHERFEATGGAHYEKTLKSARAAVSESPTPENVDRLAEVVEGQLDDRRRRTLKRGVRDALRSAEEAITPTTRLVFARVEKYLAERRDAFRVSEVDAARAFGLPTPPPSEAVRWLDYLRGQAENNAVHGWGRRGVVRDLLAGRWLPGGDMPAPDAQPARSETLVEASA